MLYRLPIFLSGCYLGKYVKERKIDNNAMMVMVEVILLAIINISAIITAIIMAIHLRKIERMIGT